MGREIQQRDLPSVARGYAHLFGEVPGYGIVEAHLAAPCHIRQEDTCEDLGNRPDFEDGATVEGARVRARISGGENPRRPVRLQQPDHDTDCAIGIHAILEDRSDLGVAGERLGCDGQGQKTQATADGRYAKGPHQVDLRSRLNKGVRRSRST
jgi:hypothetical protein